MNCVSQVKNVAATKLAPTKTHRSRTAARLLKIRKTLSHRLPFATQRCRQLVVNERVAQVRLGRFRLAANRLDQAHAEKKRIGRPRQAQHEERPPPAVTARPETRPAPRLRRCPRRRSSDGFPGPATACAARDNRPGTTSRRESKTIRPAPRPPGRRAAGRRFSTLRSPRKPGSRTPAPAGSETFARVDRRR